MPWDTDRHVATHFSLIIVAIGAHGWAQIQTARLSGVPESRIGLSCENEWLFHLIKICILHVYLCCYSYE